MHGTIPEIPHRFVPRVDANMIQFIVRAGGYGVEKDTVSCTYAKFHLAKWSTFPEPVLAGCLHSLLLSHDLFPRQHLRHRKSMFLLRKCTSLHNTIRLSSPIEDPLPAS
jgi:hypothetical protein